MQDKIHNLTSTLQLLGRPRDRAILIRTIDSFHACLPKKSEITSCLSLTTPARSTQYPSSPDTEVGKRTAWSRYGTWRTLARSLTGTGYRAIEPWLPMEGTTVRSLWQCLDS